MTLGDLRVTLVEVQDVPGPLGVGVVIRCPRYRRRLELDVQARTA